MPAIREIAQAYGIKPMTARNLIAHARAIGMLIGSHRGRQGGVLSVKALQQLEDLVRRGAIEIQSLTWDGKQIKVALKSAESQTVILELPSEISQLTVTDGPAKAGPADRANQRTIALPSGQSVSVVIEQK